MVTAGGGYDVAAWSVARETALWTARLAAAQVFSASAIAESDDGTRLFVIGRPVPAAA